MQCGTISKVCLGLHGLAHELAERGFSSLARGIQVINRIVTGADIDARARISRMALIPHTVGIVVGETAIVETGVILMPHVVLGASEPNAQGRRHPHVSAGALIGAGAVLLGPIVIGRGARVGANAVVLHDVPAGVTVVGIPAVRRGDK